MQSRYLWLTALAGAATTAALTVAAQTLQFDPYSPWRPTERFDKNLSSITSIDAAMQALPRYVGFKKKKTQRDIAEGIERLLRHRFYHGYSYYTFSENWSANLASYVWDDLGAKVEPEDILDHPWAGCSQQAIVFQALLRRSGIEYGSIRTDHPTHFASVAKLDGQWYFVDTWDQLSRSTTGPIPVALLKDPKGVSKIFGGALGREYASAMLTNEYAIGDINRFPAPRARLFHHLTSWFSSWGWLCLLAFLICLSALGSTSRFRSFKRLSRLRRGTRSE